MTLYTQSIGTSVYPLYQHFPVIDPLFTLLYYLYDYF